MSEVSFLLSPSRLSISCFASYCMLRAAIVVYPASNRDRGSAGSGELGGNALASFLELSTATHGTTTRHTVDRSGQSLPLDKGGVYLQQHQAVPVSSAKASSSVSKPREKLDRWRGRRGSSMRYLPLFTSPTNHCTMRLTACRFLRTPTGCGAGAATARDGGLHAPEVGVCKHLHAELLLGVDAARQLRHRHRGQD